MKVSIVTEGFQNTGYGHITRCLSLYQAFVEKNIAPTLYLNTDENSQPFIANARHNVIDWLTHPTRLITEIINSDILIIDSYLAGKEFYEIMSKLAAVSLFIDDYLRIDYPSGIILNGTINAETLQYKKGENYEYLLGSRYIPIREEFWNQIKRKTSKNISSVLITFGGQDVKNLTPQTTKAVQQKYPGFTKKVVLGVNSVSQKEADKLKDDKTEILYSVTAQQMKELMISCDIAITAAGQTLYELASIGTPAIAIAVADNQKNNILEWKKEGFLLDPIFNGDHNYLKKITGQIEIMQSANVRKKLSSIGKGKVDGQGSRRIIDFLLKKINTCAGIKLRKAVKEDSNLVFSLSNEPSVRQQSINKQQINWEDHQKWFSEKINDDNYLLLLVFDSENRFVGQVKYQIEKSQAVVSISITKDFRGKGFSKKILIDSASKVFAGYQSVEHIIAYILPGNLPSINGFKSAGFKNLGKEIINEEEFLKYILER